MRVALGCDPLTILTISIVSIKFEIDQWATNPLTSKIILKINLMDVPVQYIDYPYEKL